MRTDDDKAHWDVILFCGVAIATVLLAVFALGHRPIPESTPAAPAQHAPRAHVVHM